MVWDAIGPSQFQAGLEKPVCIRTYYAARIDGKFQQGPGFGHVSRPHDRFSLARDAVLLQWLALGNGKKENEKRHGQHLKASGGGTATRAPQ